MQTWMILTYNHIDEDCSSNGEMAFDLEHQGQGQILFLADNFKTTWLTGMILTGNHTFMRTADLMMILPLTLKAKVKVNLVLVW